MNANPAIPVALALALGLSLAGLGLLLKRASPCEIERVRPLLTAMDLDGDGRVSALEFERLAPPEMPLALYDADHDQRLDARELAVLLMVVDPLWLQRLPY